MSTGASDRKKAEVNDARDSILRIFQECLAVVLAAITRNALASDDGEARSFGNVRVVIVTID
jgi:hypothetical protein